MLGTGGADVAPPCQQRPRSGPIAAVCTCWTGVKAHGIGTPNLEASSSGQRGRLAPPRLQWGRTTYLTLVYTTRTQHIAPAAMFQDLRQRTATRRTRARSPPLPPAQHSQLSNITTTHCGQSER